MTFCGRPARCCLVVPVVVLGLAVACTSTTAPTTTPTITATVESTAADELFPDVLAATATQAADGSWTVAATISSPYDSPSRYADAFRVLTSDGEELGVRILTHDHASEQPFTRSLNSVQIPESLRAIVVEGRDQQSGWGGATVELVLER